MIVLYGRADDPPLQAAAECAAEMGVPLIWLDQLMLDRHDLVLTVSGQGVSCQLCVDGQTLELDSVSGIYARPLELPTECRGDLARARAQTFHALFLEWLEVAPTLVVSRPSDMDSNGSKPYQSQLIASAGFDVPETLVTSEPDEARGFWRTHGRVIFKSISGIRSVVTELDERHAARLERLRDLPVQLQAYVPGLDVRVHVVGCETFACSVESEATDYRYAHRSGTAARLEALELPACVSKRCVGLAQRLRLPFCGIDLRRTPDGCWVCFEVNPMPAYTYFEGETGLHISSSLVRLLAADAGRMTE